MIEWSVRLNNDLTLPDYAGIARAAEDGGATRMWVSHDLFLGSAPVIVAHAAAATDTLGLGIGIMNPYTVHPVELAMVASSLDELSGGRVALGLGAGAEGFLSAIGITRTEPLRRTRNAVETVRKLLAGRPHGGQRLGRPAPDVPIYVAATGPKMRALAGEIADGVLALALPPEAHDDIVTEVGDGAGGDRDVDVPCCVWLSVADDPLEARAALAPKLAFYGPELGFDLLARVGLVASSFDEMRAAAARGGPHAAAGQLTPPMERLAVVGTPDEIVERCQRLLDRGVRHLSFGPPLGPDPIVAVQTVATEVIPRLS